MLKALVAVFGIVLVALGIAACGGGGDQTASPQAPSGTMVRVDGGSYQDVTPTALKQMLVSKDFLLVNVHYPYSGEIDPTDAFVPFDQIVGNIGRFPQDKTAKLVVYCRSGSMSAEAARTLVGLGYTNVYNLDGGMVAWAEQGYPLPQRSPAP